jgi:Type II restriction enzyme SfiI
MRIRQVRSRRALDVPGELPKVLIVGGQSFLTTTVFVKYVYEDSGRRNRLTLIKIACLPNGMLQDIYNPTAEDTIWRAGPNAPTRGEEFRTRLSFSLLQQKAAWRVQNIHIDPETPFVWSE